MLETVSTGWFADLATSLLVSLIVFAVGFLIGKRRERALLAGRNLEQYDFYPFTIDKDGFPTFNLSDFQRGTQHLLRHPDAMAAAQQIVLGEQHGVRYQLAPEALSDYERLYARNHGQRVMQGSSEFLENYRRIVRLLGATFRDMGIELLLHDLVNPSRSITCIAGGDVTGRTEGMGTTSLVIDLKRRQTLNQDKLNYGLQIGARNFKCTTVPLVHERYGIVGAICINIDVNYVRDHVLASPENTREFLERYCSIDMKLDENILSRPEYEKALAGKRHWKDSAGRPAAA